MLYSLFVSIPVTWTLVVGMDLCVLDALPRWPICVLLAVISEHLAGLCSRNRSKG